MPWSSLPWYAQAILWVVIAIITVYLFQNIILPLLTKVT